MIENDVNEVYPRSQKYIWKGRLACHRDIREDGYLDGEKCAAGEKSKDTLSANGTNNNNIMAYNTLLIGKKKLQIVSKSQAHIDAENNIVTIVVNVTTIF